MEDRKNKISDTKKEQSKVLQQSLPKKDGKKKIEDTEREVENVESIEKNTEKTGTEKDVAPVEQCEQLYGKNWNGDMVKKYNFVHEYSFVFLCIFGIEFPFR